MAVDKKGTYETPHEYWTRVKDGKYSGNSQYFNIPFDISTHYGEKAKESRQPICLTCGNPNMDDACTGSECKRCTIKRIGEDKYNDIYKTVLKYQTAYEQGTPLRKLYTQAVEKMKEENKSP